MAEEKVLPWWLRFLDYVSNTKCSPKRLVHAEAFSKDQHKRHRDDRLLPPLHEVCRRHVLCGRCCGLFIVRQGHKEVRSTTETSANSRRAKEDFLRVRFPAETMNIVNNDDLGCQVPIQRRLPTLPSIRV